MWRRAFDVLLASLLCAAWPAWAQLTVKGGSGIDLWYIDSPTGTARFLPNYNPPERWSQSAGWVRTEAGYQFEDGPAVRVAARQHRVDGARLDRLDVDVSMGEGGVRVGVLPYRVAWCRPLGAGPWIKEPDAFCRDSRLDEVALGAAGVQGYRSGQLGAWLVDAMAGLYRPKIDGQDRLYGPFQPIGETVEHRKWGASAQAMHLGSGLLLRASYLKSAVSQRSKSTLVPVQSLRYDTLYLAAETTVAPGTTARASVSRYAGWQTNPAFPFPFTATSTTLELAHARGADSYALGLSRYENLADYPHSYSTTTQRLRVPSLSLAWSRAFAGGLRVTAQATRTLDQFTPAIGAPVNRHGNALGLSVSKTY